MKSQLRSRDQRTDELHTETEQLREQAARQSAIIASLKRRIHVRHKPCSIRIHTSNFMLFNSFDLGT